MKLFVTILFSFIAASVFAVIGSPIGHYTDATGTVQHYDKEWIKVKNGTAGTLTRGSLVNWDTTADDGYTITVSDLVPGQNVACVLDETLATGEAGLCQIYGIHDAVLFGLYAGVWNATAGQPLFKCSADGEYACAGMYPGYPAITALYPIGIALDASAASGAVDAFINIR